MTLNDPGTEDSGLYKCNIKNTLGELNANLTLNIEIIPVIKEKPKVVKIIKKRTVIVECKVLSKFAPECTWFKDSSAVAKDVRHKTHVEQVRDVSIWQRLKETVALEQFSRRVSLLSSWRSPSAPKLTKALTNCSPRTKKAKPPPKRSRSLKYPNPNLRNRKERNQRSNMDSQAS